MFPTLFAEGTSFMWGIWVVTDRYKVFDDRDFFYYFNTRGTPKSKSAGPDLRVREVALVHVRKEVPRNLLTRSPEGVHGSGAAQPEHPQLPLLRFHMLPSPVSIPFWPVAAMNYKLRGSI